MNAHRLRPVVVALAAVALAAALTGCQGDDSAGGVGGAADTPSTSARASSASGTSGGKGGATVSAGATVTAAPAAGDGGARAAKPASKTTAPAADCVSEAPDPDHVDPDEIALYRVEELPGSTGKVNLVIQHGAWGCPDKDTDGAPFVVTGEDARWAMDQAAYVTAANPITDSSKNRRIGVGELIDWIDAHPDSGLVFRYETGADGSIDRLEQVYTP